MALKKFKKEETNKKNAIKIVSAFMVIGIMLAGISYAVYQHEDEKLFINATVGEFKENDIELAIKLDGEQIDTPPAKDDYIVIVECDYADGEWDTEKWGALVTNINASKVKCEVNFKTPEATLFEVTATSTMKEISLSYKAEGMGTSTTCKYGTEEGNYPNEVEATNTNCNIKELEKDTTYYYQVCAINRVGEACKEGSIKTKLFAEINIVEIGDYISMIPTSTSYTPPSSVTGYNTESQRTLNPSELNLWRVIRKNEDGTVEMVSEHVSSAKIIFYGKEGYMNFVGGLNEIAAQYTNEKYVARTRHIGYSNQTEVITDASAITKATAPWSKNTSSYQWIECDTSTYLCGTDESLGAGDIGYLIDYNLVTEAIGSMNSSTPAGAGTYYWLASREYGQRSSYDWWCSGRSVYSSPVGNLTPQPIYYYYGYFDGQVHDSSIRPIITLKSSVSIKSGDGKSASTAYQLS